MDLDEIARFGSSALLADVCDALGERDRCLAPGLAPLSGSRVLVGRARPVRSVAVDAPSDPPYASEIAYLDALRPGDVVIADCSASTAAFWGELLTHAAIARGCRGAVIDGMVRDRAMIADLGFDLHARGTHPTDSNGRMALVQMDVPLEIRGVLVAPGDLVVADGDGVVVVPAALVDEAVERAHAKSQLESEARALLAQGLLLADVYARLGVL